MAKKIIVILSVILSLVIMAATIDVAFQPKPFDWTQNYESFSKQPYGAYVLYENLDSFFPGKKVKRMGKNDFSAYQQIDPLFNGEGYDEETDEMDTTLVLKKLSEADLEPVYFNILALNDKLFLSDYDSRALILHLYQGNTALISAYAVNGNLMGYLGIETETEDLNRLTKSVKEEMYTIEGPGIKSFSFRDYNSFTRIIDYPDSAEVIATNAKHDVVGIKLKIGEGTLFYFSLPIIFTNYYLLKQDHFLVEGLINQLPNRDTHWINGYFNTRLYTQSRSILDFINKNESLAWAFYFLLIFLLLYFLMQIKRTQRPIPVRLAPQNVSLKFVESISNLYLYRKNNKEMLTKKMMYFLETIRNTYHLSTNTIDDFFFRQLSDKSKVSLSIVKSLFVTYDELSGKPEISDIDFLRFNNLIQTFKK